MKLVHSWDTSLHGVTQSRSSAVVALGNDWASSLHTRQSDWMPYYPGTVRAFLGFRTFRTLANLSRTGGRNEAVSL